MRLEAGVAADVIATVFCHNICRHSMPGSPYLFGLAKSGSDIDTFPSEALPVLGIACDSRGYTLLQVCEMKLTYSVEYGLTEEAVVSKLWTSGAHLRFVHQHESLRNARDGEESSKGERQSLSVFPLLLMLFSYFSTSAVQT